MAAIVTKEELGRFQDFGLGRGVDATDPKMWDNKSPIILREICPDMTNIIGTEDGGEKQYYSDDVVSHTSLKTKINLSLTEPNSQVKIGVDAHHSRTNDSTNKIVGTKLRTRTISFRTNLSDLPLRNFKGASVDAGMSVLSFETDETDQAELEVVKKKSQTSTLGTNCFEDQLCAWILDRIDVRKQQSALKRVQSVENSLNAAENDSRHVAKLSGSKPSIHLAHYLCTLTPDSIEMQQITNDCQVFVSELGITHYVSAIELGALKYNVYKKKEYDCKMGAGTNSGYKKWATLEASVDHKKKNTQETTNEIVIGRIVDDKVQRQSCDEAVIGFHIQPIHRLVKLGYLQLALQAAVKHYMTSKTSRTEGPYLVSCTVEHKPVFWKVSRENQIRGTTQIEDASLFYVIPTVDGSHPFEFFIVYYGEDKAARCMPKSVNDQKSKQAIPLPSYVVDDGNLFGYSSRPLELRSSVFEHQARYALHSRIIHAPMMCLSSPVASSSWIEGDEYYLKCSRRRGRADGYLAMKRESRPASRRQLPSDSSKETDMYKTVILSRVNTNTSTNIGLLFRLRPVEHKLDVHTHVRQSEFWGQESEATGITSLTIEQSTQQDTSF